jgi:hypothetical protein
MLATTKTAPRGRRKRRRTVSATLKLIREGVGMELRRGTFDVLVDGKSAVSVERHDAVEVPIDPGRHTIRIPAGRYSSKITALRRQMARQSRSVFTAR